MSRKVTKSFIRYKEHELSDDKLEKAIDAVFENNTIPIDEICEIKNGKLYLSSYVNGIVEFINDKYIRHYYMTVSDLGKLLYVEVAI